MKTPKASMVFLLQNSTSFPEFQHVISKLGWIVFQTREGDQKVVPFEQIIVTPNHQVTIQYVDDPVVEHRYLIFYGEDEDFQGTPFHIMRYLHLRTSTNVLGFARNAQTDDEKCESAIELSVIFRSFDDEAFQILCHYYQNGSISVRYHVLFAMSYRAWPEVLDWLKSVSEQDESELIRYWAARLIFSMQNSEMNIG